MRSRKKGDCYKEVYHAHWFYVLYGAILLVALTPLFLLPPPPLSKWIIFSVMILPIFLISPFEFVVHRGGVDIYIGLLRMIRKRISAEKIQGCEVRTFKPLQEFGGWGIRRGRDRTWAFFFEGNRGVLIRTIKGNYLLGSRTPYKLHEMIRSITLRVTLTGETQDNPS